MAMPLSPELIARALSRELTTLWTATAGAPATATPSEPAGAMGWTVAIPVSGVATGQLVTWFEAAAATTGARRVLGGDTNPADDAVARVLADLVARAADAVVASPDGAGLILGAAAARKALPPAGALSFTLTCEDGFSCHFATLAEFGASAAGVGIGRESGDSRLEAVLEVDLPLVVRFGRAVMPLRAVAELSPGAVVDMGRSPDEPVELLVGERLIARGEVVIVGGNYGVRITELTSGRRSTDLEARS